MYESHFGLTQSPFTIAPDPRYLFLSERHREALAHLLYGLEGGGGFVLLSGEIGAGKTTLCRAFLDQVPAHTRVAYVFNPKLDAIELLHTICGEFGLQVAAGPGHAAPTIKDHIDALNAFLLQVHAQGGHSVLVIDEAQNLSADVLEQLRLLTNLETAERKLLQIILIGQPELRALLARPELEQLAQRVIARYHLGALDEADTGRYVAHRLGVAGRHGASPFDLRALQRLHALSGGVPRRINLLADRALLGAYAAGQDRVDERLVARAAQEVFDAAPAAVAPREPSELPPWLGWTVGAGLLLAVGAGLGWLAAGGGAAAPGTAVAARASAPTAGASAVAVAPSAAQAASQPAVVPMAAAASAQGPVAVTAPVAASVADPVAPLPLLRDERAAWVALSKAWGVPTDADDPCAALRAGPGLVCFRGRLPWPQIRLLDRPGWLWLRGPDGREAPVLLVGLDEREAVLAQGAQRVRWPLERLSRDWSGDFATLWRAPAGYELAVGPGARGATVDALAQALSRWDGQPAPAVGSPLEGALSRRLQAFQRAQGQPADGLAGPATFMQLNRLLGVAEARLEPVSPAAGRP
jgi:general secretion pathway protein A